MSWEDELLPASFRGVPFEVESDTFAAGRRTQLHEYVQRDEPYVEDLGRATRGISVTGFLNGDDCFDQAQALIGAFEEEGPGELVHPWFGRLMVSLDGLPTLRRERREGRTIRFDANFIESGELEFPATTTDTSMGLFDAGDTFAGVSESSFGGWLSGINLANVSSSSWLTTGTNFMNVLGNLSLASGSSPFTSFLAQFTGAGSFATSFLAAPLAIASSLFGAISSTTYRYSGTSAALNAAGSAAAAVTTVADVPTVTGNDASAFQTSSIGLMQDALVVHATRELATLGVSPEDSVTAGRAQADPESVASLDRQVDTGRIELDEAGEEIVAWEMPVVDDVLEVRDALDEAIWSMAQTASYDRFTALMATRVALSRHLTAVARSGVRLVAVTPTQPTASLVLAYRRYGDATRADEIVTRNRITHPGFVPPQRLLMAER